MDIIYRINQSDSATSTANAKKVSRTLNLDVDSRGIRIVPQGEESTDGLMVPSTEHDTYGKVFVGLDGNGDKIFRPIDEVIVSGQGVKVENVTLDDGGSGVKVSANIVGTDGVTVTQVGDTTSIGFTENNIDGITGFSYSRFGANDYYINNESLQGTANPDFVKGLSSSLIDISEGALSKTFTFTAPKAGVWNIGYAFNDTWRLNQSITGLNSSFTSSDFNRDFNVKIEIIKKQYDVYGVSQTYNLKYSSSINKIQPLVHGSSSSFIVGRNVFTSASKVNVYLLYLDSNFNIVGSSLSPVVVSFDAGDTNDKQISVTVEKSIDASYIMWSFSKIEKVTKTLAPAGNVGTITLAHQTVRSVSGNETVDGSFDRSFWVMMEAGDAIKATCTFTTGALVPICEVAFSSLYMLPMVSIGGGGVTVETVSPYDVVVDNYADFYSAMTSTTVKTIYVKKDISCTSAPIVSTVDKKVYGEMLTFNGNIVLTNTSGTNYFYNVVSFYSDSFSTITLNHNWFVRLIKSGYVSFDLVATAANTYEWTNATPSNVSSLSNSSFWRHYFWSNSLQNQLIDVSGIDNSGQTKSNVYVTNPGSLTSANASGVLSITKTTHSVQLLASNTNWVLSVDPTNPPEVGTEYSFTMSPGEQVDSNNIVIPTAMGIGGSTYVSATKALNRCYVVRLIYTGSSIINRNVESGYPVPAGSAYGCFAVSN